MQHSQRFVLGYSTLVELGCGGEILSFSAIRTRSASEAAFILRNAPGFHSRRLRSRKAAEAVRDGSRQPFKMACGTRVLPPCAGAGPWRKRELHGRVSPVACVAPHHRTRARSKRHAHADFRHTPAVG